MKPIFKHFLLTTLLFVFIAFQAFPQYKFKGGVILGINGSQIDGDSMAGFDKGGLVAGVFLDYPFSDKVFGSFEILYSMKGSREKDNLDPNNYVPALAHAQAFIYRLPFLANYKLNDKLIVDGGLGLGILVGTKFVDVNRQVDSRYNGIRPYDIFSLLGGQYRPIDKISFFVRYEYSIFNISKDKSHMLWSRTNRGLHNNVLEGGIRYYIGKN